MTGETIRISPAGQARLAVNPVDYLRDRWGAYLEATRRAGATFDRARNCQAAPAGRLHDLIRELAAVGFLIEVDESLGAHLEDRKRQADGERERARSLHDKAIARMSEIEARLAARGVTLYPYQKDGVRWLAHRRSAGLFDAPGLGKTIQALVAADEESPILVVAPAAVKGVWAREQLRVRPDLGWPRILAGRGSFRWPSKGEMVVTNYDILPEPVEATPQSTPAHTIRYRLPDWVGQPQPGTVLIYDEVHALKNSKAQRSRAARLLSDRVAESGGFVWGLSGTPLLNRPDELWHVLHALKVSKEAFGSYRQFKRLFDFQGRPRREVAQRLKAVSLMRLKSEVLPDLPSFTTETIRVPIDADSRKLADDLVAKLAASGVDIQQVRSAAEIVAATRRGTLSIGEISRVRAALAQAKLGKTLEMVEGYEAEGKPVVVWSAYLGPVEALAARSGWSSITGAVTGAERTAIVSRFAAGGQKGIACTIRSAGVGIDGLQRASCTAIFNDLDWTPGWNEQARDRICRIGQDRGVHIVMLVADHALDLRLLEILEAKEAIIDGAVNASARATVEEQFDDTAGPLLTPPGSVSVKSQAERSAQSAAHYGREAVPMPRLLALFQRVKATGIARPTIKVRGLELHLAGAASKYSDQIMVTNGLGFHAPGNKWYGRVSSAGFIAASACTPEILATLRRWDASPDEMARDATAYGHATGVCCFCGLQLTDARSVTAGYGPICAERWGLPFGASVSQKVDLIATMLAGGVE